MTEFVYNNAKNVSINHTQFELNYGYYPCVLLKNDANSRSKSHSAKELAKELKDLMSIYQQNLFHT